MQLSNLKTGKLPADVSIMHFLVGSLQAVMTLSILWNRKMCMLQNESIVINFMFWRRRRRTTRWFTASFYDCTLDPICSFLKLSMSWSTRSGPDLFSCLCTGIRIRVYMNWITWFYFLKSNNTHDSIKDIKVCYLFDHLSNKSKLYPRTLNVLL